MKKLLCLLLAAVLALPKAGIAEDAQATIPSYPPIPGIMPVDIYGNFEAKGFTTRKDFTSKGMYVVSKREFGIASVMVETRCLRTTKVESVVVSVIDPTSKKVSPLAASYFEFLASLPYGGSNPTEAIAWVKANMGKQNVSTVIGDVRLKITTIKNLSSMYMTHMDHE